MALLPPIASIANLFTRPLPTISHHRYTHLVIGDATTITPTTSVAPTVDSSATVASTLVASTTTVDSLATVVAPAPTTVSDSVPSLHLDTGDSVSISPSRSDFLPVAQAPYGLIRSPISDVSVSKALALASTPVDPYTLITGEDTATVDLASPDTVDFDSPDTVDFDSDSGPSFTKVSFDICEFGTATLTFIYSKSDRLASLDSTSKVDPY